MREIGAASAARRAIEHQTRSNGPDGYFIHFDADAIDGKLMPAVDDPSPDGFSWEEATQLLQTVARHERAVGVQFTIYNPEADPDGSAGRAFKQMIAAALVP